MRDAQMIDAFLTLWEPGADSPGTGENLSLAVTNLVMEKSADDGMLELLIRSTKGDYHLTIFSVASLVDEIRAALRDKR